MADSNLPKTYRDAFKITTSLGFRFLWIDSLCIIQDDDQDWQSQSSKMGLIYSSASCNIAASWASDGNDGCYNRRDPSNITPTTLATNLEIDGSEEYQIYQNYQYDDDITFAPLNERGWVTQERFLSQKQLSFAERQVYWECPELLACEQFPTGLPRGVWDNGGLVLMRPPTGKPGLDFLDENEVREAWCSLVETYSSCQLSRLSDKLVAIAGLAGKFRDSMNDTYLAGLWKLGLQHQLCWKYSSDMSGFDYPRPPQYLGPTWSWTSVDGPISVDSRYYSPTDDYVDMIKILNVSVQSKDPSDSHSFTSAELQIRGIGIWGHLKARNRAIYELLLTQQSEDAECCSLDHAEISVFWDENSAGSNTNPSQRRRIQEEQNSELLFVLVAGSPDSGFDSPPLGLALRKILSPEGDVFVRMGSVQYDEVFLHMLACKLHWPSDMYLIKTISLDDPRLAGLVHTVTII
jgi:hypothetical protein